MYKKKIALGVAVRCSWWRESCWCTKVSLLGYVHLAINKYQLRLDVQHFLWPV